MPSRQLSCALLSAVVTFAIGPVWAEQPLEKNIEIEIRNTFTAADLVSWVLEANPGLAGIRAAAEAAAYRIEIASSLDDPMLSYGVAPLTGSSNRGLNQRINLSQRLPWPGTLAAREDGARYDSVAADRGVDALRLRIVAQAKSDYAEWRFIDEGLAIHRLTQTLLDELIAAAQIRYAVGRGLKQDVLQGEVERINLTNELLRLRRQQATVQASINALLNRAPDGPLPLAVPAPAQLPLPALGVLQDQALAQHPELARLDAQVSASKSRITLAEKAFYPDFQVGVGYNSLWDNADKRPIFGVSINVPFDRSKRRSELNRRRADSRRAQWSLIERRTNLLAALAQARAELIEAQASVALYQDQLVPLAAEYLDAALADYQSGNGSFLNVITAEQHQLRTDLALARGRADQSRRRANLERWVGGSIDTMRTIPMGGR